MGRRGLAVVRAAAEAVVESPAETAGDDQQRAAVSYPFAEVEKKWQGYWEENKTFKTPSQIDTTKPKAYILDMFPYPRCVAILVVALLK